MSAGASVAAQTAAGSTPLHDASRGGSVDVVRLLLSCKGGLLGIDTAAGEGSTPLCEAARGSHADVCELLIEHGANIDATNSTGNTALHFASTWGAAAVVEVLIRRGADTEVKNNWGKSVLDVVITVNGDAKAAVEKSFQTVRIILSFPH